MGAQQEIDKPKTPPPRQTACQSPLTQLRNQLEPNRVSAHSAALRWLLWTCSVSPKGHDNFTTCFTFTCCHWHCMHCKNALLSFTSLACLLWPNRYAEIPCTAIYHVPSKRLYSNAGEVGVNADGVSCNKNSPQQLGSLLYTGVQIGQSLLKYIRLSLTASVHWVKFWHDQR